MYHSRYKSFMAKYATDYSIKLILHYVKYLLGSQSGVKSLLYCW